MEALMGKVIEADCSSGDPFSGITVRDETPREAAERKHISDAHAARKEKEEAVVADRQAARDAIAAAAAEDPNKPLAAGLVARALGLA
jgi:hypothetical protein